MLPADIARCPGYVSDSQRAFEDDCLNCARRTAGIADYVAGRPVVWFSEAPTQTPCPERLEPKK